MNTLKIERLSETSVRLRGYVLEAREDLSAVDWHRLDASDEGSLTVHDLPGGSPFAGAKLTLMDAASMVKHWIEAERGGAFDTVMKPVRFITTPDRDSTMTLYDVKLDGKVTSYFLEGNQERATFEDTFETRKQADAAFDESVQYFFAERISSQLDRRES